jgi:molybdate transport system ATP-binding protein
MALLEFDCLFRYPSGFRLQARFQTDGRVTALFGPSGSGKSTVLALIAGLLRPLQGRIRLGERLLVDTATGVWLPAEQRRVGVVFQDLRLFPHLTVRQNLRFGSGRRGALSIPFARVVQILELEELLERKPHALSGGQQQRVALGRALLHGPDLLLLDEPLTSLDAPLKERILTYLERVFAEWRLPTLLVSHDPAEVRRLASQVVVLVQGQVQQAGPVAQILPPPSGNG